MNFVKQNRYIAFVRLALYGVSLNAWYYGKAQDTFFQILVAGIPTDINLSQ